MVVEYPHIFPMVAEYPKMTPIVAEYPRGYSAGIEPNVFLFVGFTTLRTLVNFDWLLH